jgi:hypothetical protein
VLNRNEPAVKKRKDACGRAGIKAQDVPHGEQIWRVSAKIVWSVSKVEALPDFALRENNRMLFSSVKSGVKPSRRRLVVSARSAATRQSN